VAREGRVWSARNHSDHHANGDRRGEYPVPPGPGGGDQPRCRTRSLRGGGPVSRDGGQSVAWGTSTTARPCLVTRFGGCADHPPGRIGGQRRFGRACRPGTVVAPVGCWKCAGRRIARSGALAILKGVPFLGAFKRHAGWPRISSGARSRLPGERAPGFFSGRSSATQAVFRGQFKIRSISDWLTAIWEIDRILNCPRKRRATRIANGVSCQPVGSGGSGFLPCRFGPG
jgi:hypothetical protein